MSERDAGLTLIEMLVVLAIMAVTAGATVLSLSPRRGGGAEVEAQRLVATIQTAVDRAAAVNSVTQLSIDPAGYRISPAPRHDFPAGIVAAGASSAPVDLTFDAAPPFDVTIAQGGDRWQVRFDGLRATAVRAGPS